MALPVISSFFRSLIVVGASDSRLGVFGYESGVRFSKGSGNFLGPKANFEIKTSWIVA